MENNHASFKQHVNVLADACGCTFAAVCVATKKTTITG
jgi:hypothetical protein